VTATVEVSDLEKHFGSVAALHRVSFQIAPGTITLVMGTNGAGKSTLLRILGALTRPSRGRVSLFGEDPFGSSAAALRGRIGFVGQELGLYGDLTVEENLSFAARLHGASARAASEPLQQLGLGGVADRRVRTLSLGFRRRAALARALVADPELLLLDEPWNGLDAESAKRLAVLLAARRERGASAIVASHAVRDYRDLFDGVIKLEGGRLAEIQGPFSDDDPLTAVSLGAAP
jgi:heme ABC exporter ATP-binding subunit CcmA